MPVTADEVGALAAEAVLAGCTTGVMVVIESRRPAASPVGSAVTFSPSNTKQTDGVDIRIVRFSSLEIECLE